jgi:hypothetical protein
MVTLPFLIFLKLKATVGTTSSLHRPEVTTLTKEVFPEALLDNKEWLAMESKLKPAILRRLSQAAWRKKGR